MLLLSVTNNFWEYVIKASRKHGDDIQSVIEKLFDGKSNSEIKAHHLCTSAYVDDEKIKRANTPTRLSSAPPPTKQNQCDDHTFCFKLHCIFCGQECVEDNRHPGRRPIVKCQTADYGKSSKKCGGFKEAILEVCNKQANKQSEDGKLSILSATSDWHAADAKHHTDCRDNFMAPSAVERDTNKNV